MPRSIPGLHHVTAICGPPQANVEFYAGLLCQRLIKKTVNFDAPDTYHLYYGDQAGSPGTIMTFFPFAEAAPGRAGPGMASAVAYTVPPGGIDGWMGWLADQGLDFDGPHERFGERMIGLLDPDGLRIELIESGSAPATASEERPRPDGFHSVTLWLRDPEPTARLLTDLFGYRHANEATDAGVHRQRLITEGGAPGSAIDLIRSDAPSNKRQGAGSIHHVAFRAETNEVHREWRERAAAYGMDVTPVIDRQYFDAIYFREPGGVLFEIATDPPGFTVDEDAAELGTHLKLPPQHERHRANLERLLPPLRVPA